MTTLNTLTGKQIKTNLELSNLVSNNHTTEFKLNNKSVFILGSFNSGFGIWKDANCENYISDVKLGEKVSQITKGVNIGQFIQELNF